MGDAGGKQLRGWKGRGEGADPRIPAMAAAVLIATLLLASCSSETRSHSLSLGYPNGDRASSRHSAGSIDSGTVSDLSRAWTRPVPLSGENGSFDSSPVVVDGVVYLQDLSSNVRAIDIENGETEWETKFESPTAGPNGVFVDTKRVYGAT